jgi:hypothetical protein
MVVSEKREHITLLVAVSGAGAVAPHGWIIKGGDGTKAERLQKLLRHVDPNAYVKATGTTIARLSRMHCTVLLTAMTLWISIGLGREGVDYQ